MIATVAPSLPAATTIFRMLDVSVLCLSQKLSNHSLFEYFERLRHPRCLFWPKRCNYILKRLIRHQSSEVLFTWTNKTVWGGMLWSCKSLFEVKNRKNLFCCFWNIFFIILDLNGSWAMSSHFFKFQTFKVLGHLVIRNLQVQNTQEFCLNFGGCRFLGSPNNISNIIIHVLL